MSVISAVHVGRNDPCPCGSGRKYKQCCLAARDAEEAVRLRLRAAEGRLVPEIFHFALERWGEPLFAEAWEEFFLWENVPGKPAEAPEFETMFLPWFVFDFVPDPELPDSEADRPVERIALAYLAERSGTLDDLERRLLLAVCDTPFSFHVVEEATPGRDLRLRDLFTGADCRVLEQSASAMVPPGALIYARPVTLDEGSILVGSGPLVIPPAWHNRLIDFREKVSRKRRMDHMALAEYDIEIRSLYFDIANELYNPRPPVLTNTDGDPLELTTLEFELRCSPEEAFERLRPLAGAGPADEDRDHDDDGGLVRLEFSWVKAGNRVHKGWDNTVLGHISIEEGRLTARVNSSRRADRFRREMVRRLGARAAFLNAAVQRMDDLWEAARRGRQEGKPDPDAQPEPSAGQQAVLAELSARHWESWLDERIPALGNKTPRQAAKTAIGRERLEALFTEYAWRSESTPAANVMQPDIPALRRKLGLG
jgi:hypothetical protein